MAIYGGSPLFRYVELVYRCKRLFILAVLLATVIVSAVVATRKNRYETTMIIGLFGDPTTAEVMGSDTTDRRTVTDAVNRKVNRLTFWIGKDRDFLDTALKNANLDRKYGAELPDVLRKVRDAITVEKDLVGGQYLEVTMAWHDPDEAEKILQSVYSRFADRTVNEETAVQTNRRVMLETQFKARDKEANRLAQLKVQYMRDHWYQNPAMLGSYMNQNDQVQQSLSDAEMDLADNRVRAAQMDREMAKTPRFITESISDVTLKEDPTLTLAAKRQDLETQLQQLKQRYNESHPLVRDVVRNIAAIDEQIATEKHKPMVKKQTQSQTARRLNLEWQDLHRQRTQIALTIEGLNRRIASLRGQASQSTSRVRQMPVEEVSFQRITNDYDTADKVRNLLRAQLVSAQIDEERDRYTQASLVKLVIPPRSERTDGGSKMLLVYALGPVLGLIIAFAFSLVAEAMDHSLRTPTEVESYLGKPVLAVLPRAQAGHEPGKQLPGASRPGITGS